MPFKSEKQRRYLWANEPEIARDWTDTYGSRIHKKNGGITSTKTVKGQPHLLAYITPNEVEQLKALGGQETMTPEGIPAYPPWDNYGQTKSEFEGSSPSSVKDTSTPSGGNNNQGNQNTGNAREDYITNYVSKGIVKGGGALKPGGDPTNPDDWQDDAPSQEALKKSKQFQEEQAFKKATQTWDKEKKEWQPKKGNWVTTSLYNRFPNNPRNELAYLRQLKAAGHYIPPELQQILDAAIQADLEGVDYNKKMTFDEFAMMRALSPKGNLDFSQYMLVGDPTQGVRPNPGMYVGGNLGNFYSQPQPDWWDPAVHGNWVQHRDKIVMDMGLSSGGGGDSSNFPVRTLPYIPGDDDPDKGDPDDGGGGGTGSGVVYPYAGYGTPGYQTSDTFMNLAYPGGRDFLLARGGRVPAAFGGIMDTATGRRGYFLGSIGDAIGDAIGGVAKAAGKVLKSPIGKAAVLGLGAYYMPGFGIKATGGFGNMFNPSGFFGKALLKKGAQDWAWKNLSAGKIIGGLSALPFLGIGTKAKQDTLGVADRGGHLIDPITKKEALPAEMRASLNDALSAAWNEDKQAYESEAMAAIKQAYPFLGQYPIYKVKDGGRIGAQEGGLMNLGGMEKDYRNNGGFVAIGGEERADDVPARLSRNEFVFTADAVRGAGGGDIDKGAEIMENVMKNLEQGGKISEESQGNTGAQEMFSVSQRIGEVL